MKKQPKKARLVDARALYAVWHEDGRLLQVASSPHQLWSLTDRGYIARRYVPATSEAEVRRLKRIERAAKKVVRLCPGTELLDGLSRSLANSHELNLHREVSRSLRAKRTKP